MSQQDLSSQLPESRISCEGFEQLMQEKIEARKRLLALPPEEAQKLVEQTLYPQYWEFRSEDNVWEESIPTIYGEIDDDIG